eukprot:UN30934
MGNRDNIILDAVDTQDCLKQMNEIMDIAASDFVEQDDFFKDVPKEEIDDLKNSWHLYLKKHLKNNWKITRRNFLIM